MFESHLKPPISFPSVSGAVCSFDSQYAGLPLKSCVAQISGYQEGSGTPSPDNVRPLHAFSSASLSATGKNLIDVNINTSQYSGTYNFGKTLFGTFTLSAKKNDVVLSEAVWIVRIDYADGTYGYCGDESYSNPFPCVIDATVKGIKSITWRSYGITSGSYDLMFELGSTASPYEPFGNSYTFTFGQSIYQGSIDWERGVVVGTWSGKVDMGLLNFEYNSSFQAFYISLPNMYIPTTGQERLQGIANEVYPISTVDAISSMNDKSCLRYNGYLWIKDSDYTDRDVFKNSLIGKYVAYELATPIEIPLGGVNLLTQQGQNNIFADTGDTTLQYIKLG